MPREPARTAFLPLRTGRYWLYEARDSGANSIGLKQVLVSDEKSVEKSPGASDFVISLRDQTLPPEERPDAPMIIRSNLDGSMESVECGGLILSPEIKDGAMWRPANGNGWCSLTEAPVLFRNVDSQNVQTIVVQCSWAADSKSNTRVYADGVGLVLAVYREQRNSGWVERVERLKEYRTIHPATFPPLPIQSK